VQREEELRAENAALRAQVKQLQQRLYGQKSEQGHRVDGRQESRKSGRGRGHAWGKPGHGRRDYSHLPEVVEDYDLPEDQKRCPRCGKPMMAFPGTEDSELIEIEVQAYRRVIRRKRYRPGCDCGELPGLVTAPGPGKLIPKASWGVSVWVTALLDKFLFYRPTERLLADLASHGASLAPGTLTDGFRRLAPLFQPVYEALVTQNRSEKLWQADETRWPVFVRVEGKGNFRWYLWVFKSASSVVFVLDPSRSSRVPEAHFEGVLGGILLVDRYAAYKAMLYVKEGRILLAFCWAHVRRDFLDVLAGSLEHEEWVWAWVDAIGELYHLNHLRLEALEAPERFAEQDRQLRAAVQKMEEKREAELSQEALHPARRSVLRSLREHWQGLTVFLDHPEVPQDNNGTERIERGPVLGRKNYYGSGAEWSGHLAAALFSIFATLELWGLNPRLWLTKYLQVCADLHGKAPESLAPFLPWTMTEEQRKALSVAPGRAAAPKPATPDSS
jgi:transposase